MKWHEGKEARRTVTARESGQGSDGLVWWVVVLAVYSGGGETASAAVAGRNGFSVSAVFTPDSQDDLGSFDWAGDGRLYFATGNFTTPQLEIARWDGTTTSSIYHVNKWLGGGVQAFSNANDHYVFFYEDDPSTFQQNLVRHTIATGATTRIIQGGNLSGLHVHGDELYVTAVGSGGFGTNEVFFSPIGADGSVSTLLFLGALGRASGPVVLDVEGNLYFADGFDTKIFKYTSAEVTAAIADTINDAFAEPNLHVWADYSDLVLSDGVTRPAGATGMAIDRQGDLVLIATRFGEPSAVVVFDLGADGLNHGRTIAAEGDDRIAGVRSYQDDIYFNDTETVYLLVPEPAGIGLMMLGVLVMALRRHGNSPDIR